MRTDGQVLPDLAETVVLHRLGLIRTDELPALAARWLAADLVETPSIRMLAGHDRHDPWGLDQLLTDALREAGASPVTSPEAVQHVAVGWVTHTWRDDRDTRRAVTTLAHLGETFPDFDLGLFVGMNDEWNGGWGRLDADLKAEADKEIDRLLHGPAHRTIAAMPTHGVQYQIDGIRITTLEDFYDAIGEAVNGPGGYFGRNLDALNDCLRGGFGTPDDEDITFVWTDSEHARRNLGYPETIRQLELRLARCHPTNRDHVRAELDRAAHGEGPTVFDWIIEIFQDQQVTLTLQ
jgi:RNAse (barnase) inhibitor barstar